MLSSPLGKASIDLLLSFDFRPLGRVFKPCDPPQPPLKRGENLLKVLFFKRDLGGGGLMTN